jgi:hypothetical protein
MGSKIHSTRPKNTLNAASKCYVALNVKIKDDPSVTSSKSFDIQMESFPLQLFVLGSAQRKILLSITL